MTQTALYRHWDGEGRLLYVGISKQAMRRLAEHGDSAWAADIANVTIERFSTRPEAAEAEKRAIQTECPVYNRMRFGAPKAPETEVSFRENRITQKHYDGVKTVLDGKGSHCCFAIDIASWIMDVPVATLDAMVDVPVGHLPCIMIDEMYVLLDRLRAGPQSSDKPIVLRYHADDLDSLGWRRPGAQLPADEWLVRRPLPAPPASREVPA